MYRILLIIFTLLTISASVYAGPEPSTHTNTYPHQNIEHPLELTYRNYYEPDYNYDILNHITWDRWSNVPGATRLELVGIQDSIISQIKNRVRQQAEDDLRIEYNLSNMSDDTFRNRMDDINSEYNPYGEWWERSWIYSLPPEKGGAPKEPIIYSYGWEFTINNSTPIIGWFKQKFESIGDIWISADHQFVEERGQNPQRNDRRTYNDRERYANPRIETASLLTKRDYRWFENSNFHLRFRPTVKLSTDNSIIEEIALRAQIELYNRNKTHHFGNINLFIKHDINENNTFFSAFLEIITW